MNDRRLGAGSGKTRVLVDRFVSIGALCAFLAIGLSMIWRPLP